MDYISVVIDSIETSINMKIFENEKKALHAHIFKSKLKKIPLSKFKNIINFNPNRLQKTAEKAYPLNNRPREIKDIKSVKYYLKEIKQKKEITPIWMIYNNNDYILLDGAHRIVSSYIGNKKYIYSYVIYI
jgi:hypothetical protein